MRIRRFLLVLLAVMLLSGLPAQAASQPVYIQYGDVGRPIGWLQIGLGVTETWAYDNGTIAYFGDKTLDALDALQYEYGLTPSGMFDDETLYLLLDPPYSALYGYEDPLVWIPMYGGVRYHADYRCSDMIEPRQMPVSCAELLGFTPCGRCYQ